MFNAKVRQVRPELAPYDLPSVTRMNRTLLSLVATFGGLVLTLGALLAMCATCVFGHQDPARLFATDLGIGLVVGFIAGVVLALAGVVSLLVVLRVPPSKK